MQRTSLSTPRSATQQQLASSSLPLMTEEGEASYGNLKQVVLPLNQVGQHVEAAERYIQIATTAERLHGVSMYISASGTGQFLKKSEKSNLLELMIVAKAAKLNECETLIPSLTLRSFESIWTFQSGRKLQLPFLENILLVLFAAKKMFTGQFPTERIVGSIILAPTHNHEPMRDKKRVLTQRSGRYIVLMLVLTSKPDAIVGVGVQEDMLYMIKITSSGAEEPRTRGESQVEDAIGGSSEAVRGRSRPASGSRASGAEEYGEADLRCKRGPRSGSPASGAELAWKRTPASSSEGSGGDLDGGERTPVSSQGKRHGQARTGGETGAGRSIGSGRR